MAENFQVRCFSDISNIFTRGQHNLDKIFGMIDGYDGVWSGLIPNGGQFPVGSGFAARTTTMGQQRLSFSRLKILQPMVGLQNDCAISCDPPVETLNFGNAQHNWYRLTYGAFNTVPYCLESMWGDALNLEDNIRNIYISLKHATMDVMDEFYRNNHAAISYYRWNGYVDASGQQLQKQKWRFATDANGDVDTTYIILENGVDPENISQLSVSGFLNLIRDWGQYTGTFPKDGNVELISDYLTFSELPLYDTNVRADNRYRAPVTLDPSYAAQTQYGGYSLKNDPFALRYYWTETDPLYPGGVLKRIDQWKSQEISEGCFSQASLDYQNADFQVSFMWGKPVFQMQNGMQPMSAPGGVNFSDQAAPWNGAWRWVNEVNEITPCNVDKNKGFWRAVFKLAAKPIDAGFHGNSILHRRFPYRGITKVCKPLGTPSGGSTDCTNTCPPLDLFPPPLVDTFTCGSWNADHCGSL